MHVEVFFARAEAAVLRRSAPGINTSAVSASPTSYALALAFLIRAMVSSTRGSPRGGPRYVANASAGWPHKGEIRVRALAWGRASAVDGVAEFAHPGGLVGVERAFGQGGEVLVQLGGGGRPGQGHVDMRA